MLQSPGHRRFEASRTVEEHATRPPHEAIAAEANETPDLASLFDAAASAGHLPPAYWSHPVVEKAPVGER
eukprot:14891696-Alexandrium_andersonii.AAC.1